MHLSLGVLTFTFGLAVPAALTQAGEISAIVEYMSTSDVGVQPMEILEEGRVIELGDNSTLTLGYLRSCIRETITGGKVTVGLEESKVENGKRLVEEVDCDGGSVIKSSKRGDEVVGAVYRKGDTRRKKLPKPQWTLYGTDPVLRLSKPTKRIVIERLDKEGHGLIDLAVNGVLIDLSKVGVQLDPGGLYAISDGKTRYVLKVSPLAVPEAPLLSRFIPM